MTRSYHQPPPLLLLLLLVCGGVKASEETTSSLVWSARTLVCRLQPTEHPVVVATYVHYQIPVPASVRALYQVLHRLYSITHGHRRRQKHQH